MTTARLLDQAGTAEMAPGRGPHPSTRPAQRTITTGGGCPTPRTPSCPRSRPSTIAPPSRRIRTRTGPRLDGRGIDRPSGPGPWERPSGPRPDRRPELPAVGGSGQCRNLTPEGRVKGLDRPGPGVGVQGLRRQGGPDSSPDSHDGPPAAASCRRQALMLLERRNRSTTSQQAKYRPPVRRVCFRHRKTSLRSSWSVC